MASVFIKSLNDVVFIDMVAIRSRYCYGHYMMSLLLWSLYMMSLLLWSFYFYGVFMVMVIIWSLYCFGNLLLSLLLWLLYGFFIAMVTNTIRRCYCRYCLLY